MKNTKSIAATILMIAAIIAIGMFVLPGCSTTDANTVARVAMVAELASYDGATLWLEEHPNDRSRFVAAEVALGYLENDPDVTPEKLRAALKDLPIKELRGRRGSMLMDNAIIIYDGLLAQRTQVDKLNLRPISSAIRSGIRRALEQQ
jgi:hypothetical protein